MNTTDRIIDIVETAGVTVFGLAMLAFIVCFLVGQPQRPWRARKGRFQ